MKKRTYLWFFNIQEVSQIFPLRLTWSYNRDRFEIYLIYYRSIFKIDTNGERPSKRYSFGNNKCYDLCNFVCFSKKETKQKES